MGDQKQPAKNQPAAKVPEGLPCGVVMPISAIDNCSESHWQDVKSILFDAIKAAGFEPFLVSDADDIGVIHRRIVQNLYQNPIVVCDVSARNANVMFELGMRLAFDKATIVVKDDVTPFSFDTAPIEHLSYRRDLRFADIVRFKTNLAAKIKATHQASLQPGYSTFLKHFGTIEPSVLPTTGGTKEDLILQRLDDLSNEIAATRPFRYVSSGGNVLQLGQPQLGQPSLVTGRSEGIVFNRSLDDPNGTSWAQPMVHVSDVLKTIHGNATLPDPSDPADHNKAP